MTINELVTMLTRAQSIGLGNHIIRLNGTLIDYCPEDPELVDVAVDDNPTPYVYMEFREKE